MDDLSPETDAHPLNFPVIGIGASAGGLEAIRELLGAVPADSGLAVLAVLHLDPARPSHLAEILAKSAALRVLEATDDAAIEPNNLYVIPPNTSMTVAKGRLKLKARVATHGPPMPIDDLLDSLAKDQRSNAVGVILSGTGSDGALGMQAIKECGGTTFAQDEASARFGGMPRAAMSLGCIDLALAPENIGAELVRLARHPYLAPETPGSDSRTLVHEDDGFKRVFRQLKSACNIDFSHYKRGTVERRLARRLALHDLRSVDDYLEVIEGDPAEAHALCRDLLIKFTEFFRDPEAFEALADTVFPRILQAADPNGPIRIWVPGCSTGEEVYSIAICLLEYMGTHSMTNLVQIFGTDVSDEALEIARAGRYIENIARDVSAERLQRFFVREGDRYRVAKMLRDCCTFARQNVAYDPPFSRIDLVSCRNLLIYLDPVLQRRVMPSFHFALQSHGVLMLGMSETVGPFSEMFAPLETRRGRIFSKKPLPGRPYVLPLALPLASPAVRTGADPATTGAEARSPAAGAPVETPASADAVDRLRREVDRVATARYAPACVLCDDELNVLEFRGDTGPFLLNPPGPPTHQLQRLARPGVFLALSDALRQVRKDGVAVRKSGLRIEVAGQAREGSIEVVPLRPEGIEGRWLLIFFHVLSVPAHPPSPGRPTLWPALRDAVVARLGRHRPTPGDAAKDVELARSAEELGGAREQIRLMLEEHESALEELKSIEEETLSSNEEFQSTNEELETAKEELQSVNEELSTTNDELRFRNREMKTLHDEVAQARDYDDAILETMAEPLLVLDASLRVTRANRAFFETFKTSPRETLHRELYALGDGQWNIPALRELLEDLLPRQTQVRDFDVSADFPRIGHRTMRLNARRVAWPEHAFILLTFDDVSARSEALQQLVEGGRQKDEFLAMLAHELRNPLAAISNALHIWKRGDSDEPSRSEALRVLERQLRNQVRLVDDLLDVSRITRGVVLVRTDPVDLAGTVRSAYESMASQIAAHGHHASLALPVERVWVQGDMARVEQIVTNLLGNAIKYTPSGGRIEVTLERRGAEAVLTVADNGIGMAPEFLEPAFGIFVQAEKSLDRSQGGLGLGLALVRRLAELHGGTVQAQSPGLGQGSTFVLRLPALAADVVVPAPEAEPERAPAPPVPRRVLVVDDNRDAAESSAILLRFDGHEVRVAYDGPTGLRQVVDFSPDVVFLDIGLPGMDGYEVCRRVRSMPAHASTLMVALSGYGGADYVKRAHDAGFDHHITKPADPKEIEAILRSRDRLKREA